MKTYKTNLQKVTEFMEIGLGTNQAFTLEAIDRYAKQIIANKEKVIKEMDKSFISGGAWVQSAEMWVKINK